NRVPQRVPFLRTCTIKPKRRYPDCTQTGHFVEPFFALWSSADWSPIIPIVFDSRLSCSGGVKNEYFHYSRFGDWKTRAMRMLPYEIPGGERQASTVLWTRR